MLLKSQKGVGILLAVLSVAVLLLVIISASGFFFQSKLMDYRRMSTRILANQVLQDFGQLAQKANAVYVGNANVCPAGYIQHPAGRPFCWSQATNADCVRVPTDSNTALSAAPFCLGQPVNNAEQTKMDMALNIVPNPSLWLELKIRAEEFAFSSKHFIFNNVAKIFAGADYMAWAQGQPNHLPTTAGRPQTDIGIPACSNATPGNTNCKRCAGGPGVQNVDCISLRVCVNIAGCAGPEEWYQQQVGIMSR